MKRSFLMAAVAIVGLAYAPIAAADHHEGCDDAKSAAHAEMGCEATSAAHAKMLEMDIVEVAVHAGSFNTLVAAVQAAGLVDTLKGEGPFTVFAPTDEAFAKIPKDQLEALLEIGRAHV